MASIIRLDNDVIEALVSGDTEGHVFRITTQLDRKLYERVNKALEALGGKWSRKDKGHVFGASPEDAIEIAVATGEVVDNKKRLQFYETPEPIARRMVELLELPTDGKPFALLEPSCGHGALIAALPDIRSLVYANDVDGDKVTKTMDRFTDPQPMEMSLFYLRYDFMTEFPPACFTEDVSFDYVLMNPPFTKQQDIDHVARAFNSLKDGGRLVACMSAGFTFRDNQRARDFRMLVQRYGWTEANDAGAFKESGTGVNTVLVVLDK